jgi:hypothetical protein
VSTPELTKARVKVARRQISESKDYKDKRVAVAEYVRDRGERLADVYRLASHWSLITACQLFDEEVPVCWIWPCGSAVGAVSW